MVLWDLICSANYAGQKIIAFMTSFSELATLCGIGHLATPGSYLQPQARSQYHDDE